MEVGSRIKLQKNSGRSVTLSLTTPAMVGAYFAARVEPIANIEDADRLRLYLKGLLERKVLPPMRGNSINLTAAAKLCGIPPDVMKAVKKHLMPIADSICRTLFRSEEYTSELQSLMRTSYAVLCFNKQKYI